MKKQMQIALFLTAGLAILLFFASGLYCVLPEQVMHRQMRAYLVQDFEIIREEAASLYQMDFNPEYLMLAQDSDHLYLGHVQGNLDNGWRRLGHWEPAGDLTTHPRGEVLSFIPSPIMLNAATTEAQQAESGYYSMDTLPVFVIDESLQGDTVEGTLDFTIQKGKGFYERFAGLRLEIDARAELDAEGRGMLSFSPFGLRMSGITPDMEFEEDEPLWLGRSLFYRIIDRDKAIDLHLTLLKDGEAIHTETARLGEE